MAQDPEKLDILERAGFAIERSGDMVKCAFGEGAGGHHTDVGGGARIIAGQVSFAPGNLLSLSSDCSLHHRRSRSRPLLHPSNTLQLAFASPMEAIWIPM